MRQPTLEEVAAAAGVSKMTASRALRGAADVSSESIAKVRAAAEQLGYVGNRLALSLSAKRTNLVSVVVPSMSNIVFPEVVSGITHGLEGSGLQAVFGISDYDAGKEREVIRNMLSWRPAALIITGLDQPQETLALLRHIDIPVIQLMDLDGEPLDFNIGLSHHAAGAAMGRALIAAGRRRFGYIGSMLGRDLRAAKRREGFAESLRHAGLDWIGSSIAPDASSALLGKQMTRALLASGQDIDCLYYSNDDMAAGGLFACMELGIAVPSDILIAGFNGLDLADALPVQIATSRSPRRQMGEAAAHLVRRLLKDGRDGVDRVIAFTPDIVLGAG